MVRSGRSGCHHRAPCHSRTPSGNSASKHRRRAIRRFDSGSTPDFILLADHAIRRAKDPGFSLLESQGLLRLSGSPDGDHGEVRALAQHRLADIERSMSA